MPYELIIEQKILRGDTWDGINFVITKPGTDYTTATVKAQFRNAPDENVILSKTITPNSAGMNTIDFDITLTAEETKSFKSHVQTDIEITVNDDVRTPILIKFTVTKDITKT